MNAKSDIFIPILYFIFSLPPLPHTHTLSLLFFFISFSVSLFLTISSPFSTTNVHMGDLLGFSPPTKSTPLTSDSHGHASYFSSSSRHDTTLSSMYCSLPQSASTASPSSHAPTLPRAFNFQVSLKFGDCALRQRSKESLSLSLPHYQDHLGRRPIGVMWYSGHDERLVIRQTQTDHVSSFI